VRKAVIDVGSNSVLLLVEELTAEGWKLIEEDTAVTALGEGTRSTGLLSEARMDQTLDALQRMFRRARDLGVERPRAAATMAVRIATNADAFLQKCLEQQTPVEVISGEEEARLGFESVAMDPKLGLFERISIVDPGGHSTELLTARKEANGWEVEFKQSFPVGTLGLKSEILTEESPGPAQILEAIRRIDDLVLAAWKGINPGVVVVLGATGTNLISIREGLETWQPEKVHGAYLMFEEISRSVGWLMQLTDAERREIKGMEKGREKTLHIGALILERFLHVVKAEGCYVSAKGWRHAMLES
jgi:exopolyphosphatase/guanosine-5'-triphosphate,3'-diphosphate pyrophosphatase